MFPVEHELEGEEGPPTSTPRKGEDPFIPELVKHFKSLQTTELKQMMAALSREMVLDMSLGTFLLNLMAWDPTLRMSLQSYIV